MFFFIRCSFGWWCQFTIINFNSRQNSIIILRNSFNYRLIKFFACIIGDMFLIPGIVFKENVFARVLRLSLQGSNNIFGSNSYCIILLCFNIITFCWSFGVAGLVFKTIFFVWYQFIGLNICMKCSMFCCSNNKTSTCF